MNPLDQINGFAEGSSCGIDSGEMDRGEFPETFPEAARVAANDQQLAVPDDHIEQYFVDIEFDGSRS